MVSPSDYTSASISKLTQIERVRKFPARFLGDDPLTTAAREIIDNAGDEVGRGFGDTLHLIFRDDSIEVCDNGRGLPIDFDSDLLTETGHQGANGIVKTLGTLGAGANYTESDDVTAGVHGEGGAATNALCSRFDVTVYRDGKRYSQQFDAGMPGNFEGDTYDPAASFTIKEGVKLKGTKAPKSSAPIPGADSGTSVRFTLDTELTPDATLDVDGIIRRAEIAAQLRPGMTLKVTRDGETTTFDGPVYGAATVLERTGAQSTVSLAADFQFTRSGAETGASVDLAAAPVADPDVMSVMNTVWTPDGGRYQDAALAALGEGLASKQVRSLKREKGEPYPSAADFAAVSSLVVHVTVPAGAKFTSQDKSKVAGERGLNNALSEVIVRRTSMWASSPANSKALLDWAEKALAHARLTRKIDAAKAASAAPSSQVKSTSALALPDKLLPCRYMGPGNGAELHLCEGSSALGTIKAARDSAFQAAYPLRGKVINTRGKALSDARKNAEFRDIEAILGCGVRENCDPAKCRFDRIFLTTDADVDGYNISSSLLDLFIVNYAPLILAGMVYVAMPPLFIVTDPADGNRRHYAVDDADRDITIGAIIMGRGDGSAENMQTTVAQVAGSYDPPVTPSDMNRLLNKDPEFGGEAFGNSYQVLVTALGQVLPALSPSKRPDTQRCKGLGEMTADDFAETVMDPDTRTVYSADYLPERDDNLFDVVFGNSAAARRDWMREMSGGVDADAVVG